MKKILTIAAVAALALTLASCTKETVIEAPAEEAISMSAFTPVATKSSVLTGTVLSGYATDFIVNAYQGTTQFMTNVDIRFDSAKSAWNYKQSSDTKYWPNDESAAKKINFYAYAPVSDASMSVGSDNKSMTVTAPVDNASQNDILYAQTLNCSKSDRQGDGTGDNSGKVKLTFKHALSQVNFAFKCENSNLTVTIKGVSIMNVANQATESFDGTTTKGAGSALTTYAAALDADSFVLNGTAKKVTSNNPMLLAPQAEKTTEWNKTASDATGSRFAIDCEVKDATSGVVYYSGIAYVPASFDWKAGKSYTYTINFSTGAGQTPSGEDILQIIEFNPEVTEWTSVEATTNL